MIRVISSQYSEVGSAAPVSGQRRQHQRQLERAGRLELGAGVVCGRPAVPGVAIDADVAVALRARPAKRRARRRSSSAGANAATEPDGTPTPASPAGPRRASPRAQRRPADHPVERPSFLTGHPPARCRQPRPARRPVPAGTLPVTRPSHTSNGRGALTRPSRGAAARPAQPESAAGAAWRPETLEARRGVSGAGGPPSGPRPIPGRALRSRRATGRPRRPASGRCASRSSRE